MPQSYVTSDSKKRTLEIRDNAHWHIRIACFLCVEVWKFSNLRILTSKQVKVEVNQPSFLFVSAIRSFNVYQTDIQIAQTLLTNYLRPTRLLSRQIAVEWRRQISQRFKTFCSLQKNPHIYIQYILRRDCHGRRPSGHWWGFTTWQGER